MLTAKQYGTVHCFVASDDQFFREAVCICLLPVFGLHNVCDDKAIAVSTAAGVPFKIFFSLFLTFKSLCYTSSTHTIKSFAFKRPDNQPSGLLLSLDVPHPRFLVALRNNATVHQSTSNSYSPAAQCAMCVQTY